MAKKEIVTIPKRVEVAQQTLPNLEFIKEEFGIRVRYSQGGEKGPLISLEHVKECIEALHALVQKRYVVYKVFNKSGKKEILRRNLTLEESRTLVNSYPSRKASMVVFTEQI